MEIKCGTNSVTLSPKESELSKIMRKGEELMQEFNVEETSSVKKITDISGEETLE